MYCKKCGAQMDDNLNVCPDCGAVQNVQPEIKDDGGFLWGLLGCCVPIAGLVLYLI